MYRIRRTSTISVPITAAAVALILLTSATLTTSVYAARHHHGHRSIEDMATNIGGYQTYGLGGPPLSDQVNPPNGNGNNRGTPTSTGAYQAVPPVVGNQAAPPVSDQANGNGNNPVGNQAAPPVSDQANGNGNNPVGKEQIQTHAPTITYKSPSSNDMLMSFANITQPLCAAGICSQSYTNH